MTTKVSKNLLDTVYVTADGTTPMTGDLAVVGNITVGDDGVTQGKITLYNNTAEVLAGTLEAVDIAVPGVTNDIMLTANSTSGQLYLGGQAITFQTNNGTQTAKIGTDGQFVLNATPPSDPSHLTRKDYVDTTTVALDGSRTMTGTLDFSALTLVDAITQTSTDISTGGWARCQTTKIKGTSTGNKRFFNDGIFGSDDTFSRYYVSVNPDEATPYNNYDFAIDVLGSPATTTTPTLSEHLTRKDYVDDNFLDLREIALQEMSGDLSVTSSTIPTIRIFSSAASSVGFRIISVGGDNARIDTVDNTGAFSANSIGFSAGGVATFAQNPLSTNAQASSTDALTKKSYVDDNFVHLDGSKTMTGGLLITAGNPQLRVRNAVLNGLAQVRLQDFAGGDRVQQIFNESNGFFEIQLKDAGGTLQTKIGLTPSGALAVTGTISTIGTVSTTTYGEWTSADTDIDGLIAGATTSGALVEAPLNAHFTIGLRSNDTGDGFQVLSKEAGNANYTKNCFEVTADGNTTVGGTLDVTSNVAVGGSMTSTGKLTIANIISTDGSIQLWEGDTAAGYAIGVESNTLFYRANAIHRWYIGTLADAGVSSRMELTTAGLEVANVNATTAVNLGSTQQATIEFNATENSIDFIIN